MRSKQEGEVWNVEGSSWSPVVPSRPLSAGALGTAPSAGVAGASVVIGAGGARVLSPVSGRESCWAGCSWSWVSCVPYV